MAIGVLDRKLLWGRAGNRCSYPECHQQLTMDMESEESDLLIATGIIIGEEAHIRSSKDEGPRHEGTYEPSKLDTYENLLLLCPTHHTMIDKNSGAGFSIGSLLQMKQRHEDWVSSRLSPSEEKDREYSERMLALILTWEKKSQVNEWQNISAGLNLPIPWIMNSSFTALIDAAQWLLKVRRPYNYPEVARALENFDCILSDLLRHLNEHMASSGGIALELDREYKRIDWNPERYDQLLTKFYALRIVTYVLTAEATRAMNWVIEAVTREVDPYYRFNEGLVLMADGDGLFNSFAARLEYTPAQTAPDSVPPYPGLAAIVDYVAAKCKLNRDYFDKNSLFDVATILTAEEEIQS